MLSELMVAAKGISSVRNITGGSSFSSNISSRSHGMNQAPLAGGLAGIVGRQFIQNTMTTMTGQTNNVLGRKAFENSLKKVEILPTTLPVPWHKVTSARLEP